MNERKTISSKNNNDNNNELGREARYVSNVTFTPTASSCRVESTIKNGVACKERIASNEMNEVCNMLSNMLLESPETAKIQKETTTEEESVDQNFGRYTHSVFSRKLKKDVNVRRSIRLKKVK
mmetsp:Transcript_18951/g.28077  ORF Transcript_18951/g.28077 Transcript_18951/m.28077 type:complete len:123 (+) Transcript_18951:347-715(+)